jgi:hypothetical protein
MQSLFVHHAIAAVAICPAKLPIGERDLRPFGQLGHDVEHVRRVCRIVHDVDAAQSVSQREFASTSRRLMKSSLPAKKRELRSGHLKTI